MAQLHMTVALSSFLLILMFHIVPIFILLLFSVQYVFFTISSESHTQTNYTLRSHQPNHNAILHGLIFPSSYSNYTYNLHDRDKSPWPSLLNGVRMTFSLIGQLVILAGCVSDVILRYAYEKGHWLEPRNWVSLSGGFTPGRN